MILGAFILIIKKRYYSLLQKEIIKMQKSFGKNLFRIKAFKIILFKLKNSIVE